MPARKPSPVGAHVPATGGLVSKTLPYVESIGGEAMQIHAGNPRGWKPPAPDPVGDEAFATAASDRNLSVFVHSPYLINLGSPSEVTRANSLQSLRFALQRGKRLGARGVVVHAGSAVESGRRDTAYKLLREGLLPVLDSLADGDPVVLVEPTAGGGEPLAATLDDLAVWLAALDDHPRVLVCLDTCHLFAAGHDVASPGGMRSVLNTYRRVIGRGRLGLVHGNDSRDPLGSNRDRHANIGHGSIGEGPFAELFRHLATRNVAVLVETPAENGGQVRDIGILKQLRDQ